MASSIFEYIIKLTGAGAVTSALKSVTTSSDKVTNSFAKMQQQAFKFNQIGDAFRNASQQLDQMVAPGIKFESQMKDLQAITGTSGKALDDLGNKARANAKIFGGDASKSVESYKLLLSQLGPDIAKTPKALEQMGTNVSLLSKTMGGDTIAATEVLTSAMNQYGVDLTKPMEATHEMSRMMNIMSAAAKEGSAELPFIKKALENVGAVAKGAGVSFSETNSAIQLLDKYGKKGAEGGVALRNVLGTISKGRFMPKDVLAELSLAGIDVNALADKTKTLAERLSLLKPVQKDSALLTKLFGTENELAGFALIQNTDAMTAMQSKIVGTNTTVEQAQIVMSSYAERMSRLKARFSDLGISIFNSTKEYLPLLQFGSSAMVMWSNMMPLLSSLGGLILSVSKSFLGFGLSILKTAFSLTFWKKQIALARYELGFLWLRVKTFSFKGFIAGLIQSGAAALRAGASWVWTALVGLGSFISSMIVATAAQIGLNIAMTANPIGLVVLALVAVGAAVYGIIKHWDVVKVWLIDIGKFILKMNPFYWLIKGIEWLFPDFMKTLSKWWDAIVGFFKKIGAWFKKIWDNYLAPMFGSDSKEIDLNAKLNLDKNLPNFEIPTTGKGQLADSTVSGISEITSGGKKQTNINITLGKFQENLNIYTDNVSNGINDMQSKLQDALLRVLNSANAIE